MPNYLYYRTSAKNSLQQYNITVWNYDIIEQNISMFYFVISCNNHYLYSNYFLLPLFIII